MSKESMNQIIETIIRVGTPLGCIFGAIMAILIIGFAIWIVTDFGSI